MSAITKEAHRDYIYLMNKLTYNEKKQQLIKTVSNNKLGTMDGRLLILQFAPVLHPKNHHT